MIVEGARFIGVLKNHNFSNLSPKTSMSPLSLLAKRSACSEGRPKNPKPNLQANFTFCPATVVSDFWGAPRNILEPPGKPSPPLSYWSLLERPANCIDNEILEKSPLRTKTGSSGLSNGVGVLKTSQIRSGNFQTNCLFKT